MEKTIIDVLKTQRKFQLSADSKNINNRISALKRLKSSIKIHEEELLVALWKDLRKSRFESYTTEIGIVYSEIDLHIKNIKKWASPKKVSTPQIIHFYSVSKIYKKPYGQILIIAPWNYPFQLLINPLIGAISAGNCAVLKPSEYTPNVATVLQKIIESAFNKELVAIFLGGIELNTLLLQQKWDLIFFTGSPKVGKIVMKAAAENTTPVILELGGKSPCIIDKDANLKTAASRVVWGKLLNAGQTCIAPDYFMVHKDVKQKFMSLLADKTETFYGLNAKESEDYGRISTKENVERLSKYLIESEIYYGGEYDIDQKYFQPTILNNVSYNQPVMKSEIFGPIFPIIEFDDINEVIGYINKNPRPLALYYFGENKKKQQFVLTNTNSGGACINEVVMHIANHNLPFGGVGNSGIGNYHGKASFEAFSHSRSVLFKSTFIDIKLRYPSYSKFKERLARLFM